jgi:hypothetical protein
LQVGGVTAAAAAGAVAAELVQPPAAALADGIGWQTGVVNADNQTFVEPAGGSFPDPTLLTVRVGIAAPYLGLTAANSAAIAAYDTTDQGTAFTAIYATSINNNAVVGRSENSSFGVLGESGTSTGVAGGSNTGTGVAGVSNFGVGGYFSGGEAPLQLAAAKVAGAPTSGGHVLGEIWLDSTGTLWVCTAKGTPGTWTRLSRVLSGSAGGAITYLSKPIRLLDTRPGATDALHNGGGPYTSHGSPYPLTIAGASFNGVTIPNGAVGAIGNVIAIATTSVVGHVAVGRHGTSSGLEVVQYSTANQKVENSFNIALGSGQVDLTIGGSPANVILDVCAVIA